MEALEVCELAGWVEGWKAVFQEWDSRGYSFICGTSEVMTACLDRCLTCPFSSQMVCLFVYLF